MGWFNKTPDADKPQGTVNDARRLLRTSEITPGRELLRRICKYEPQSFDAHILLCPDLQRPPIDGRAASKLAMRADAIAPNNSEVQSIFAIASLLQGDVESVQFAYKAYCTADERREVLMAALFCY
jgi:hypothetical protein